VAVFLISYKVFFYKKNVFKSLILVYQIPSFSFNNNNVIEQFKLNFIKKNKLILIFTSAIKPVSNFNPF